MSRLELSYDLLFLSECIDQGFAVVEINVVGDVMDGSGGHQTAPVDFEEIVPQCFFQITDLHPRFVYLPAGHMDLGSFINHQDI